MTNEQLLLKLNMFNSILTKLEIKTTPDNVLNVYNSLCIVGDLISILEQQLESQKSNVTEWYKNDK